MLNEYRKKLARHSGGKPIKNQSADIKRAGSALSKIIALASGQDQALAGVFGDAELNTLRSAMQIIKKAAAVLDADANEANCIKADFDRRFFAARDAYNTLPRSEIADLVALVALSSESRVVGKRTVDAMCQEPRWMLSALQDAALESIALLAMNCAIEGKNHDHEVAQASAAMQEIKRANADAIARLNVIAVAAEMERAAHAVHH